MRHGVIVLGLALLAAAVGYSSSALRSRLAEPQVVYAQTTRAEKGIRIALFDPEAAARRSLKFNDLQLRWHEIQMAVKAELESLQADYDKLTAEQRAAVLAGDNELA
ncbi:MAG: hypothetical protein IT463_07160 [Planctomycetes bacterium]|nr:hypothetical protein [Planctomycetota bacterium]